MLWGYRGVFDELRAYDWSCQGYVVAIWFVFGVPFFQFACQWCTVKMSRTMTCDCPNAPYYHTDDFASQTSSLFEPLSPTSSVSVLVGAVPPLEDLPIPLPGEEPAQSAPQKKKRVRKPRAPKRKLDNTDSEYGAVASTLPVKGGRVAKKKKGSEDSVREEAMALLQRATKADIEAFEGSTKAENKENIPPTADVGKGPWRYMNREMEILRMSARMAFCQRNQLQWHIQQAVTQVVHDVCVGCKNNCITDHTLCNHTPTYVLSVYAETCARILMKRLENGRVACDDQFCEAFKCYDSQHLSAVRMPSSILAAYFIEMYPDAPWLRDVVDAMGSPYLYPPPRFDESNAKSVMLEVLLGPLAYAPAYTFFFK